VYFGVFSLVCFELSVGLPVQDIAQKIVSEMTYYVLNGSTRPKTLNSLTHSLLTELRT